MTRHDTGAFKKVAVLTGLTVLVGGAEISSAATLVQDLNFGPLSGPSSSTTLNFNQFNLPGTLTEVEVALTSQIFEAVGTNVIQAHVFGHGVNATFSATVLVSPENMNTSSFFLFGDPFFIGAGTVPYGFQYSVACGEGPQPACDEGWSGDLKITYTYDPASSTTPLPAALPLFASGAAGLGFIGWLRRLRQKVKKQA